MLDGEMTVKEALLESSSYFSQMGLEAPRLEAEVLLCFALGLEKEALYAYPERPISPLELSKFKQLVEKRAKGVPSAYLTGRKEFMSLEFLVNPQVLIPRPETELLVEAVIKYGSAFKPGLKILDLGTGSGAIAISLAYYLPGAKVTATDISEQALLVARRNALHHRLADRITFYRGDLYSALPAGQSYHVIVSNPPYIPSFELQKLSDGARCEPTLALDGGEDGLCYYCRIIENAAQYMKKPGLLALEMGRGQEEEIKKMCHQAGIFSSILVKNDYASLPRVLLAFAP